eukprot:CAMPEP_0119368540 /NCGR_PEP_ID=MMETSP1334-20130426/15182_1 /TAXON_ID=127549 /ORGANISM="Calcidiscus leptoporus, Strain RCC1130" /LENGTH=73 /DNA_ID=CAMNT_0007385197 /DNA_START=27 /DNA_END=245 /DNA_ORIENTATION=-
MCENVTVGADAKGAQRAVARTFIDSSDSPTTISVVRLVQEKDTFTDCLREKLGRTDVRILKTENSYQVVSGPS